jgi:hypothetical protein
MKLARLSVFLALPLMFLLGCAKYDRQVFNTLSVSNSVLETAQVDYESGKLPRNACVYNLINKGKTAQGIAEAAFLDEWQTEQAKGDTSALQLQVADDIASIAPIVTAIQTLYKNPTCKVTP